jgi:hypothetical protein
LDEQYCSDDDQEEDAEDGGYEGVLARVWLDASLCRGRIGRKEVEKRQKEVERGRIGRKEVE